MEAPGRTRPLPARQPDPGIPGLCLGKLYAELRCPAFCTCGFDAYILVLDTKGINVWCAAGKGTFGTDELVEPDRETPVLPASSPTGRSSSRSWEHREFPHMTCSAGPASGSSMARSVPGISLNISGHGKATPEMRRVEFPVRDRIVLAPVELVHVALPTVIIAARTLVPCRPGCCTCSHLCSDCRNRTLPGPAAVHPDKGLLHKRPPSRGRCGNPVCCCIRFKPRPCPAGQIAAGAVTPLLIMPAVTAYLALNFTGSTTFTSRTGVRKEIFRYSTGHDIHGSHRDNSWNRAWREPSSWE